MAEANQNSEPVKYVLDFEVYLNQTFNGAAGMRSSLKKLDDGQYVVEYEADPTAQPIMNATGGLHLVNNLRLVMNRHSAFGNLKDDDIAMIAGNIIRATITPMFVWKDMYGIKSNSSLDNFGLNLFESMFTYLTSIKETAAGGGGGIKDFGEKISTVQYVPKPAGPEAQKGLY